MVDLRTQPLAKIQKHARKVPANLLPAGLSERDPACTAQTFTQRHRGSPHFQALKGRTAVVPMDAGAPFAKALRCFGFVAHSCPLETLRLPQARDRINKLCRESSFVVYATLPLTYIDGVLAVKDSHGKPGQTLPPERKGGVVQKIGFLLGWQRCGGISARGECLKFLWPVPSEVFGPSTVFSTPLNQVKNIFKVACTNLLNVPDNSLCIAPHSSCRQSHRSHLHLPFRCLLSQPPPSHLAILYAALAVNQILNGKFSSVWSVLNEAAVGQQHS